MDLPENHVESLWHQLSRHLLAFIRSRVEDEDTAEDILQDVFLRIHARLTTVQDLQRLQAWIFQIARNAIVDHYRLRRPTGGLDEEIPAEFEWDEGPDAAQEIAGSLRELVEALPGPYREALMLSDLQGVDQKAIAERLGISISGAKSRVQRARQKIRDELMQCCHFEFDRYGRIVDFWEHCCCCEACEG